MIAYCLSLLLFYYMLNMETDQLNIFRVVCRTMAGRERGRRSTYYAREADPMVGVLGELSWALDDIRQELRREPAPAPAPTPPVAPVTQA